MSFRVVLDACVLIPYTLSCCLLRLAEADLYTPLWSEALLEEVERNLGAKGFTTPERAQKRVDRMRDAFPEADVRGFEGLIPKMTNDPKDRHVLAAAVHGRAGAIVTANLSDFREEDISHFGLEAIHPDEFLMDLFDLDSDLVIDCLRNQCTDYQNPPLSLLELLASLTVEAPGFAAQVENALKLELQESRQDGG